MVRFSYPSISSKMTFKLFSYSFLPVLCFLFVFLVKIQLSVSNPNLFQACTERFQCGNITACYPFWGRDRQIACGHPNLELRCENDTPTMVINDVTYRVLYVDEKAGVLKIARQDYLDGICQPKLLNTTIDSGLFEYSPEYQMLTLTYSFLSPEQSTCSMQEVKYNDGFIKTGAIGPRAFNVSVNVPVPATFLSEAKGNLSSLKEVLNQGFEVKWKVSRIELCEKCIDSNGRCGYEIVSKQTVCHCPNGPFNSPKACPMTKDPLASSESSFNKRGNIAVAVAASAVGITVIVSILLILVIGRKFKLDKVLLFCTKKTEKDQNMEAIFRNYGSLAPKRYSYSDVKKMTKSFGNKLGQGGYGDVYKGTLPDNRVVAVKVLRESKDNREEFINEVTSISRTSHVNIVTLLGFCYESKKRALIYEFMPNGSLDKFIYDQELSTMNRKLEWKTMYQIAVGIARGLEYLHRGCNIRIVHFDIKPHNILLDENFCPKISDFGLAKQSKKKDSTISMLDARGTVGYIAPEVFCRNFGGVSHKSDVYSYGMMILEMVGERRNIDVRVSHTSEICFPDSIYKHLEPGNDFKLQGVITEEEEEMAKKMISVSLWCIQTNPSDRPSMNKVVEMLEGSLENMQIPPKSYWFSPTRSPKHFSLTTSSTQVASEEDSCIS